jgi:hypothetical protein
MNEPVERTDSEAHAAPRSGSRFASWPTALGGLMAAMLAVLAATGWFAGAVLQAIGLP